MMDLQGQFLIAMPHLDDYFYRTVVFICEHNEQGSMGIVINQPTDLSIAELYSKLNFMMKNDRTFDNAMVVAGGPVHMERGFIVHKKTANDFQHSYKIADYFRGCSRYVRFAASTRKIFSGTRLLELGSGPVGTRNHG